MIADRRTARVGCRSMDFSVRDLCRRPGFSEARHYPQGVARTSERSWNASEIADSGRHPIEAPRESRVSPRNHISTVTKPDGDTLWHRRRPTWLACRRRVFSFPMRAEAVGRCGAEPEGERSANKRRPRVRCLWAGRGRYRASAAALAQCREALRLGNVGAEPRVLPPAHFPHSLPPRYHQERATASWFVR
jgi:hypothetical protein